MDCEFWVKKSQGSVESEVLGGGVGSGERVPGEPKLLQESGLCHPGWEM